MRRFAFSAALLLMIGAVCNGQVTFQVTPAKDGSLWCATDKGAVHIVSDGSAKIYNKSTGLNDDLVTQVILDADGTAWFVHAGVFAQGRSQVQAANGVSHLRKDGSIEILKYGSGLPTGFVYAIVFEPDGTKWFATNGGAVRRKADGTSEIFDEKKGLPSSDVRSIVIDSRGTKWFATGSGVVKMDRQDTITTVYPKP
jgi:ligand-binding sensor domain-containing protein